MASATRSEPGRIRKMLQGLASKIAERSPTSPESAADALQKMARLGMTPRQQELNWLYSWYKCQNYTSRRIDWNGREVVDPIEHESIATVGFIPSGFTSVSGDYPLKFRKPTAPYALIKVIVDRFTGMIFSERRHPQISAGDREVEQSIAALVDRARVWQHMIMARQYGGSMGSVAVGFQFVHGVPVVEVHDPRWLFPEWENRQLLKLRAVEKRYLFVKEERNKLTGVVESQWFWYRRVIDETRDTLYHEAPVLDGEEPQWEIKSEIIHNFGFCPVVWAQNLPVQDDIDGDTDCTGIYDTVEAIDTLLSQAERGIIANCDPTLLLKTNAALADVAKGSDNAIKLPADGDGQYMEITGTGLKLAIDLAQVRRAHALEVAQCVLDHPDTTQRTATEIEKVYSSMTAKCDILREQYGQKLVLPLVDMMVRVLRRLTEPKSEQQDDGTLAIVRYSVDLPPRIVDGVQKPYVWEFASGLGLKWPPYFEITLDDVTKAATAASTAKTAGFIDTEHAVKFIAPYFRVEDAHDMYQRVVKENAEKQAQLNQSIMGSISQQGGGQ